MIRKAIYIDDEEKALLVLGVLLKQFNPTINLIETFRRVKEEEHIQFLKQNQIDILFIDSPLKNPKPTAKLVKFARRHGIQVIWVSGDKEKLKKLRKPKDKFIEKPIRVKDIEKGVL